MIRSDTMMEGIDAQLLEVFGEEQLRSNQPPPADNIFDNVSSDSSSDDCQYSFDESDEEICHNDILFASESRMSESESESEWSICAGEWSPISDCSDSVA